MGVLEFCEVKPFTTLTLSLCSHHTLIPQALPAHIEDEQGTGPYLQESRLL